jgi:hypothetical protein
VSRPDTRTLAGCSSLRLFDKNPGVDRCSGLNPRRIRVSKPCSTPGLAVGLIMFRPQIGFKTHRRKVIHSLTARRFGGTLRSAMNNFGNGIRVGELASLPWVEAHEIPNPERVAPACHRPPRTETSFGNWLLELLGDLELPRLVHRERRGPKFPKAHLVPSATMSMGSTTHKHFSKSCSRFPFLQKFCCE